MRIWRISDDLPAPVSPIIMKCELSGSRGIRTTLLATVELRCRGEHWAFGPAPVLEHAPPLPVFGNREYRPPAENCRTGDERPIQEVPPVWSWSIQCRMNSGNAARSPTSDPISKGFNTDKTLISHCAKHSIGAIGQREIQHLSINSLRMELRVPAGTAGVLLKYHVEPRRKARAELLNASRVSNATARTEGSQRELDSVPNEK